MKKWAYIIGGFFLGIVVAISSQSALANVQTSIAGEVVKNDDKTNSAAKVIIDEKGLIAYDEAGNKRVALGINDESGMSGLAFYDQSKELKGQAYSVPDGFHIIGAKDLLIRSFGKTVIQGDVVFEGNVKFKGTVDFSEAKIIGLE